MNGAEDLMWNNWKNERVQYIFQNRHRGREVVKFIIRLKPEKCVFWHSRLSCYLVCPHPKLESLGLSPASTLLQIQFPGNVWEAVDDGPSTTHTCGRSGLSSELLSLTWPRPGYCSNLGSKTKDRRYLFFSLPLCCSVFQITHFFKFSLKKKKTIRTWETETILYLLYCMWGQDKFCFRILWLRNLKFL